MNPGRYFQSTNSSKDGVDFGFVVMMTHYTTIVSKKNSLFLSSFFSEVQGSANVYSSLRFWDGMHAIIFVTWLIFTAIEKILFCYCHWLCSASLLFFSFLLLRFMSFQCFPNTFYIIWRGWFVDTMDSYVLMTILCFAMSYYWSRIIGRKDTHL